MSAEFRGVPARLFAQAARELNPRFGAFIQSPDRAVLSLSPELFLRRHGRDVESSPIKGTWARDAGDPDDPGAVRLRQSGKDVAENVMIVDLVRNDLGRVCGAGTVQARQLLDVQPFPGVWHLVSTIGGDLRPDVGDADLIAATFPPGSVTGAPKVRALRAITELEDHPRGVYTGAVGLCAPASGLTLAVAIRTFEITGPASKRRIELGVGGGVTADSVPELEWRECAQKAAPLLRGVGAGLPRAMRAVAADPQPWQLAGGLLETMLAVDAQVLRLADHLARLERSCRELYRRGLPADLEAAVRAAVQGCTGRYAVRVVVSATGAVRVSATPASPRPTHSRVTVVPRAGVWRHKWADRSWVGAGETATEQSLYVAEDGSVLETSRGNVFLVTADGTVMTAPLRDDLLPGVTRRAVLDLSRDRGRPAGLHSFSVGELAAAQGAFWVSSISGPVAITALDGCPLPLTSDVRVFIETLAADLGFDCVSAAGSLGSAGSPASVASSKVLS